MYSFLDFMFLQINNKMLVSYCKGSDKTNTHKENGSFSCEKRIYELTEMQTITLTGTLIKVIGY